MSRILLVDDEPALRASLGLSLRVRGHAVLDAVDGAGALRAAAGAAPDVVLLDLGLPDIDGLDVLQELRRTSSVPIIVLTARDDKQGKLLALDGGADDYVTKPFDPDELMARIRVVLRRLDGPAVRVVRFGPFELDLDGRELTRDGEVIALTRHELGLLAALATRPGRLLTHAALLQEVWGPSYGTEHEYLRTFVAQLRRKLGDRATSPRLIRTEPGLGYRWIG